MTNPLLEIGSLVLTPEGTPGEVAKITTILGTDFFVVLRRNDHAKTYRATDLTPIPFDPFLQREIRYVP